MFEKKYSNGLELVIQKTQAPVVSMQVWVDVGSVDEQDDEAGYCHFLEHMLFKGTKKRTTAQIAGTIEGAGGEMNAYTSFEQTVYYINISNDKWQIANDVLSDMLLNSQFYPNEFFPEKEVILEEIKRNNDSPDRQIYQKAYSQMYFNKDYGKPVIGNIQSVSQCNPKKLKKFWQKWYSPALMTIAIAGDVDVTQVEKKIAQTWGKVSLKPKRERKVNLNIESKIKKTTSKIVIEHFPVNCFRWVGVFPGVKLTDENIASYDVAAMIFGQGENSRIHRKLFREKKLVTSAFTSLWAPRRTGLFFLDVESAIDQNLQFKTILFDELERFANEGPTKEELERAKISIENERIYSAQTMDGVASRLGYLKVNLGNIRFDLEYQAKVRDLTAEDVRRSFRNLINPQFLNEFCLVPEGYDAKKIIELSEKQQPIKSANKLIKDIKKIEKVTLSNGIELALFYRDDLPLLSIQSACLGGLRNENNSNFGIGSILSDVWDQGPKGIETEKFNELLESKASRIDGFSGRNSVGLSCTMISHYIDEVLPLYLDTLVNPSLNEKEVNHAKTVALEECKTLEDDSSRLVAKLFLENMFEGHPYASTLIGSKKSIVNIHQKTIDDYFQNQVQGSRFKVAVSGKFNFNSLISQFEKIKTKPDPKHLHLALPHYPKSPRVIEIKKNRQQSHIIVGYKGNKISDHDRYALKMLITILSGQSGRLFRELRDKKGLCYTVSPIAFEGVEPGYVGVYMGCDPQKRHLAIDGIFYELERLTKSLVSTSELEKAKNYIIGRNHMDVQNNPAVASSASLSMVYGLPFDEHLVFHKEINKITKKQIQEIATKFFSNPSVTAIVV